jgi:ketosteroid isomerase-like protein
MSTARNIPDISIPDQQLNQQILAGDALGAFEKYYAEDVVMQENEEAPRKGKAINRKFEKDFFDNIEQLHGGKVLASAVNGDTSFSEWEYDVTFKGAQRITLKQVSVRRWANGKIIHEKFYYNKAA